jgi:hypothetical protein
MGNGTNRLDAYDRDQLAPVRKALRNPNLPAEAVLALAHWQDRYVLSEVASHLLMPAETLQEIFARRDDYLVRWGLPANSNTPAKIIQTIARPGAKPGSLGAHTQGHTLSAASGNRVARNPAAPNMLMLELAQEPSEDVRSSLAICRPGWRCVFAAFVIVVAGGMALARVVVT